MLTAFAILGVLAALFLAAALATRDSEGLAPAAPDAADLALPEGPLDADDVRGLRFGLSPRGYRMSEVDTVLERLAAELEARDQRIAALEAGPATTSDVAVDQGDAVPVSAVAAAEGATAVAAVPSADGVAPQEPTRPVGVVEDLDFPEVSLPEVDDTAAPAPDLSVGQAPVEPVDPPLRSS